MNSTNLTTATNLTNFNATAAPTVFVAPSLPPFMIWIRESWSLMCLFVAVFLFIVTILVCWKGAYKSYPSVIIRWVLYLEILMYAYFFFNNYPDTPLYPFLKTSAYEMCHVHSILGGNVTRSIMFLSALAVFSVYRITKAGRSNPFSNRERQYKRVVILFWSFNFLLIILSFAGGFDPANRCRTVVPVIRQIRGYVPLVIMGIQGLLIIGIIYNLAVVSRRTRRLKVASGGKTVLGMPRDQFRMLLRFVVIFGSQVAAFVPGLLVLFLGVDIDIYPRLWLYIFAGLIDGLCALANQRVLSICFKWRSLKYLDTHVRSKNGTGTAISRTQVQPSDVE